MGAIHTKTMGKAGFTLETKAHSEGWLSGRTALIVFAGLIIMTFLTDYLFFRRPLEDAFITFRYAKHLAEGYGLGSWNTDGTRVEGYSSFLWMLLLAGGERIGISSMRLSWILAVTCQLAMISFLFFADKLLTQSQLQNDAFLQRLKFITKCAAILVALYLPLDWYAFSGMEVAPFALLVTIAVVLVWISTAWAQGWLAVVCVLLVTLRPEGVFVALMCQSFVIFETYRQGMRVLTGWLYMGMTLMTLATLTALRLAVFGEWLPNPYYAKVSGEWKMHLSYGIRYLGSWFMGHLFILLPIMALGLWLFKVRKEYINWRLTFLFALIGLYVVYILKVGGDNFSAFPLWRHLVHIIGPLALLFGAAIDYLLPDRGVWRLAFISLAIITVNATILIWYPSIRPDLGGKNISVYRTNPYYTWLAARTNRDDTIASSLGGELPFIVDCKFIDILGLNNYHIAHFGEFDPEGPIDSKTDMDYVMEQRPAIIEGYISGTGIRLGLPRDQLIQIRKKMLRTMLENHIFKDEYLFIVNGPYKSLDRALFIHRGSWQQHSDKAKLQCTPVTETSLYR